MRYLIFICILLWAGFGAAQAADTRFERQLDHLLADLRAVTGVPAFSVAAVHRGKLVASVASGEVSADGAAATPDHLFRLASVSKIVGATMLADLAAAGGFDVDAPIGAVMPDLPDHYHAITARQLMAHTSGMPHYQLVDALIDGDHYTSATAALTTLRGRDLLAAPGAAYHYSSHGYTLAGALYERLTGKPLSASLPDYVAGMTGRASPLIEDVTRRNPRRAGLFGRMGSRLRPIDFNDKSYCVLGAGLTATAPDLAYFGQAVLDRARRNPALAELLFTPVRTNSGKATGRPLFEVAFGWRVSRDARGRAVYHHAGVTPGARSVIVLYPDEDLTLVFLSNSSWTAQIERTAFALATLYLDGADEMAGPVTRSFTGTYGDQPIGGTLRCGVSGCRLSDAEGALTSRLLGFNPTPQHWQDWPAFRYKAADRGHIVVSSKIGFIDLQAPLGDSRYQATLGQTTPLAITFQTQSGDTR